MQATIYVQYCETVLKPGSTSCQDYESIVYLIRLAMSYSFAVRLANLPLQDFGPLERRERIYLFPSSFVNVITKKNFFKNYHFYNVIPVSPSGLNSWISYIPTALNEELDQQNNLIRICRDSPWSCSMFNEVIWYLPIGTWNNTAFNLF